MRLLAYTCVFGGYDRVFPPAHREPGIDYVIITDDPGLRVAGWRTEVVGTSTFRSAKAPNRHFKMVGHPALRDYDASVYVDGNIRIINGLVALAGSFLETGAAIGLYPHPSRHSVGQELLACLAAGKIGPADHVEEELAQYRADGFPDEAGLAETGVLVRNHAHPALEPAMALWWSLFERFDTRDQLSLPYVLWKTRLPTHWFPRPFRTKNPNFGIYPHLAAKGVSERYAYVAARSYDSALHLLTLRMWHAKWRVQRSFRKRPEVGP
jgi:hypothetical protein